jgi:hypothetical protein
MKWMELAHETEELAHETFPRRGFLVLLDEDDMLSLLLSSVTLCWVILFSPGPSQPRS